MDEEVLKALRKAQRKTGKKLMGCDFKSEEGMMEFIFHSVTLAALKFTEAVLTEEE